MALEQMDLPAWLLNRNIRVTDPPKKENKSPEPLRAVFRGPVINDEQVTQILSRIEPPSYKAQCSNLINTFGFNLDPDASKNLCLFGSVGTGKTTIGLYLMDRIAKAEKSEYFVKGFRGILERLWIPCKVYSGQESWSAMLAAMKADGYKDKEKIVNSMKSVDGLLIDDLGAEVKTKDDGFDANILWEIINYRIWTDPKSHSKRTVITTNLTPAQLAKKYRPNIADRLKHGARVKWIKILGPSFR